MVDMEDTTILYVSFFASLASAACALLILFSWLCSSNVQRHLVLRLIVFLSLANLLTASAYLMSFVSARINLSSHGKNAWCLTQAMLMVVFEDASILWTVAIAITMHQQLVVRNANVERLELWYHLVCWGAPLALAIALLLNDKLGQADMPHNAWCWIANGVSNSSHADTSSQRNSRWLQLGAFYLPLAFAFTLTVAIYVRVGQAFASMVREGAIDAAKEHAIQLRIRLYLLVFFIVWAPPLVHRFLQAILVQYDPFWLRCVHTATQCSMGALNCLVYGCNRAALRPYKEAFRRCSRMSLGGIQLDQWLGRKRDPPAPAVFSHPSFIMDRTLLLDAQAASPEGRDSADRPVENSV